MSRSWMSLSFVILALPVWVVATTAQAQTVGRVSKEPLSPARGAFAAPSDAVAYRIQKPAPAERGEVIRASYLQPATGRGPAPAERLASSAPALRSHETARVTPLGSLPPATRANPWAYYHPTSYQANAALPRYTAPGYPTAGYSAANYPPTLIPTSAQGCGPAGAPIGWGAPPVYPVGQSAPYPPQTASQAPGARPFLPISQMPASVYVTRGLIGQPVVYVPGQPLRNAIRYILP